MKAPGTWKGVTEMTFTSILDKVKSTYRNRRNPEYIEDLNINRIIERIQFHWVEDIASYYHYFPENEECEKYRRDVYKDIKNQTLREAVMACVEHLRQRDTAIANSNEVKKIVQDESWKMWGMYHYCCAFEKLYEGLMAANPTSEGFKGLTEYLKVYLADEKYKNMSAKCKELTKQFKNFNLILVMENDKISITQGKLEGSYETFLKESFPDMTCELRSPFRTNTDMTPLEEELFKTFYKKNKSYFKEMSDLCQEYENYGDEVLLRFRNEVGFYMSFQRFEEIMKSEGFAFTVPQVDSKKEFHGAGVYDLALACVNYRMKKPVVSNEMVFHEDEMFFVVTGPNQGGKTTFARSLGQLVYFTKLGLDVPAIAANVPYYCDILSHFSVEESVETGRGKLKEELVRLEPMMKHSFENAFVIINELFTTAANYDACIMGKRVLKHFMDLKCHGVYVTHMKELSEEEHIVSLKALSNQCEENGKVHNIRTYKIVRGDGETMGYVGDLVDKYQLSYQQICLRMGRGL